MNKPVDWKIFLFLTLLVFFLSISFDQPQNIGAPASPAQGAQNYTSDDPLNPSEIQIPHFGFNPRRLFLPVVLKHNPSPVFLQTKITNIYKFIDQCPNRDPNYAAIRKSFTILKDGVPVSDIPCTEPYSAMPISGLTSELITLQAMRIAYYMDPGKQNTLPWTSTNLFPG